MRTSGSRLTHSPGWCCSSTLLQGSARNSELPPDWTRGANFKRSFYGVAPISREQGGPLPPQFPPTGSVPPRGFGYWRAAVILVSLIAISVMIGVEKLGRLTPSFDAALVSVPSSPGILNPACRSHALEFDLPKGWSGPDIAAFPVAQVTSTGTTVVALADPAGSTSTILMRAFTNTCQIDTAFGRGGSELLRVEIGGKPARGINVTSAAPESGGGIVLGGTDDDGMIVGVIDQNGVPDRAFGGGGWVLLGLPEQLTKAQFTAEGPGSPTAIAEEPSGEILIGNSEGGGCCETEWLGALGRSGQLINGFGEGGWSRVPYSGVEDEIVQVALDSDGHILVLNDGAHMGFVVSDVSEYSRNGTLVASFEHSMQSAVRKSVPPVFSAGLVLRVGGFVLVGTGQPNLVGGPVDPKASGFVLTFDDNGLLGTRKPVGFSSPMLWQTWASERPNGYLLIGIPAPDSSDPTASSAMRLTALTADGRIDKSFGIVGKGSLTLPDDAFEVVSFGPQGEASVVTTAGDSRIEVVELRS
jgi:hypothetical protein